MDVEDVEAQLVDDAAQEPGNRCYSVRWLGY